MLVAVVVAAVMVVNTVRNSRLMIEEMNNHQPDQTGVNAPTPPSEATSAPPVLPEVPATMVGGTCYCPLATNFCDCPVGSPLVRQDPPAIKPAKAQKSPAPRSGRGEKKPRQQPKKPVAPAVLSEPPVPV